LISDRNLGTVRGQWLEDDQCRRANQDGGSNRHGSACRQAAFARFSKDKYGCDDRRQRAKLINDLPPEFRKLIEDVTVDRHGNVTPRLYSKAQANRGLRELLNIGRTEPEVNDASRLSDHASLTRSPWR
jgi:hypothetical protein